MPKNDKIVLDKVIEEKRVLVAPSMTEQDYFEVFTSEQLLKDYNLSYDEILEGIVDGSEDGGIDSIYVFINGDLLQEDGNFSNLLKDISLDLIIIQSKTGRGITEKILDSLISTAGDLFDLSKPIESLKDYYNADLLKIAERFRRAYGNVASRFPKFSVTYHLATKMVEKPNKKILKKVADLKDAVKAHFSSVAVGVELHGAAELLELARRAPKTTHTLVLSENPISAQQGEAFISLASLESFRDFISDDQGNLFTQIFEANVRDYQGRNSVNQQIQDTLQRPNNEDFWWLNNGVTILATKANLSGKILNIENPEIVNGLQTSREIFDYFSSETLRDERRNILVRVIVPEVAESRFRIIRATNSQTMISPASLRATEIIHRHIEDYLRPFGWYYDRRKNFYKNDGKPIDKIISIPQLAQAVEAIVLHRPDTARARPSSLIKEDEDYIKLFNDAYPVEMFHSCVDIIKSVDSFFASQPKKLSMVAKNDLKFYMAMIVANLAAEKFNPDINKIVELEGLEIREDLLLKSYKIAKVEYERLGATDQVAKGTEMLANINKILRQIKY